MGLFGMSFVVCIDDGQDQSSRGGWFAHMAGDEAMTAKKRLFGLAPIVAETARAKNLLLPETEEEIAAAEAEVAGLEDDLPQRLRESPALCGV